MQGDIHEELIESPIEEGRVESDNRVRALVSHSRSRGERFLLRDTNIHNPLGELLLHRSQANGLHHCGGDTHHLRVLSSDFHNLFSEDARPAESGGSDRQTRLRVDRADGVESVGDVLFRGRVAPALLGNRVQDHRTVLRFCEHQFVFEGDDVVSVDRAEILQAEIFEHDLWDKSVLESRLDGVQSIKSRSPRFPEGEELALAPGQSTLIAFGGPERIKVKRKPPDSRSIRTPIVVDNDEDLRSGEAVEPLPGHSARQSTITDDRDCPGVFPLASLLHRDPIGPGD